MQAVAEQKIKLEQKKNRLAVEEIKLKMKERKIRTRHLIEMGGLIVKAELDHLPTNTLYGSLLSLKNSLAEQSDIKDQWTKDGKEAFDNEEKSRSAVILKFETKPEEFVRTLLRSHGLKFNHLRQEWYGYVINLDELKTKLTSVVYDLEIVNTSRNI